jgi:hypothetical protein
LSFTIFDHRAMAPDGGRIADVEADEPGNLPADPHGHATVRDAAGKIVATYDPCNACKYSDTAFSPKGNARTFLASGARILGWFDHYLGPMTSSGQTAYAARASLGARHHADSYDV